MARATTRHDSAAGQFYERIPADLRDHIRGKTLLVELPAVGSLPPATISATAGTFLRFSLRATDPAAVKYRHAAAKEQVNRQYEAFRRGPAGLTHRQLVALSGEVYRLYIDQFQENPGTPDQWAAVKAFNRAASEGRLLVSPPALPNDPDTIVAAESAFGADLTTGINALPRSEGIPALESRFGWLTDWVLTKHGVMVDAEARSRLLALVGSAMTDAAWQLKRNAAGDYSPDPKADRFPKFETTGSALSLEALFDKWRAETKPSASTLSTWSGRPLASLKAHLAAKASDVRRIEPEDIIAWKDAIVARDLAVKSINGTYLGMANAIFNYAVMNRIMVVNPAAGVRVAGRAKAGTGKLPYENAEVSRLLELAQKETKPDRRWLPWLAASTGARIGELAQLWGSRVKEIDGIPVIALAPAEDGGSLKNEGSERTVPIHRTLIEQGFLEFVKERGAGPLFYRKSSGKTTKKHASKGVTNRLAGWIREIGFDDPRKAPNHAFRHWFKSAAVRVGISDSMADAIQGHAGKTVASRYRHFDIKSIADAVALLPLPPTSEH
jgi:integrase